MTEIVSVVISRGPQGVPGPLVPPNQLPTATADVPLGGHKLTGVGDATAATDALNRQTGDGRYEQSANKGVAGGYASLDGAGKVPASQLTVDAVEFKGTWDASANAPTLADGAGSVGDLYRVSVAGTQNLGSGAVSYAIGDDLILDAGSVWRKISGGAGLAPLASPAFTGTPTAPTPSALDNSTKLATSAYADAAVAVEKSRAQGVEATNASAISAETTRAAAAEATKQATSAKDAANGYAGLDAGGLLKVAELPTSVVTDISASPKAIDSTGVTNGQGLVYDSASGKWKPGAGGGGGAVSSVFGRTGAVVAASGDYAVAQITGAAPLASPALTGTPTAPTATGGTNTTQIATTAFVASAITPFAPLASPTLTGNPTAPTQTFGDNSTKVSTTAFVAAAVSPLQAIGATEVFCAAATGTASTDTTNLTNAIAATPTGGTLWLDGHYKIQTSALAISSSIAIRGRQKVTYSGLSALPSGPNALSQLKGTMIEQTTVGVDGLAITIAGGTFHIADVIVAFTSGLASTGHGINCAPASNVVGVYGGSLERVLVFGHDGNHYGLVRTNSLEFTTTDFRWWGGGGILDVATAGTINYGNTVDIHPYGTLTNAGSAHGFAKSSAAGTTGPAGSGGSLNLMTFIRPQVNIAGAAGAGGTQKAWSDTVGAAYPWAVNIVGADFEASGFTNIIDFGPGTKLVGDQYFSTQFDSLNTALGYKALGTAGLNVGTQHKSVAVGYNALASVTTSLQNTAVGYFAGNAITTGTGLNTLVGYQAGKLITTGSTNTAVGGNALAANLTGGSNTAVGKDALLANTASSNTALGSQALNGVIGGSQHVAVGTGAGQTNPINANYGTFVGYTAGTSGDFSGVTAIGNSAKGNAANTTALGKGAVASSAGGVAIGIDSTGATVTAANADTIALGTTKHVVLLAGAATVSAPSYQKGAMHFDTTLNKLRVGGATAWETVTSS